MSRLIELTEKALASGLNDQENDEFAILWNEQADGFEEAVELFETEALLGGLKTDIDVERGIFEEILSESSDKTASGVMATLKARNQPKPDFNSIRRREKAGYYPVIFAVAALLVISFIIIFNIKKIDDQTVASIDSSDGIITLKRHGKETHLKVDSILKSGDEIVTNEDSSVQIKLEDGTGLAIEESTSIAVNKNAGAWELKLSAGTVKTKVSPQKKTFKMTTPALQVQVVGTEFTVTHVNGISTVSVFEGIVKTTSLFDGKTVTLTAGHSFSANSEKVIHDTSKEKIIFSEDFESGKIKANLSYVTPILSKNAPWGNNSKWTVETQVSTHPQPKKYEVRGPLWRDDKNGLFKYKKGMKLKFKYWLNEHSFWLGVWMRVDRKNQNLYTSIENPAVKRWAEITVELSELTSKLDNSTLFPGAIINRLNIQTNPDPKSVLYIDDVRVVEE